MGTHTHSHNGCCDHRKAIKTLDGKTLADVYLKRVSVSGDDTAYLIKKDGKYQPFSWNQVHDQVLAICQAHLKNGIQKGDRVCIMSNTRPEWNMTDLANFCVGAVTVPIYHSNAADDVAFMLEHSEAKMVFAEDESLLAKLSEAFKLNKKPIPVVCFAGKGKAAGLDIKSLDEYAPRAIENRPALEQKLNQIVSTLTPDTMASIVYTSGTTGRPKGVVVTHENFASEVRSFVDLFELSASDSLLSFLPFAHILGRVESTVPLFAGITMAFAENISTVAQNIQEVHPTILISVPRIYEKIYAKIINDVAASPPTKQKIFNWAVGLGKEAALARSEKRSLPFLTAVKFKVADQLVFSKIRAKLGGNLRFTVSGGAPLAAELCQFFHAAGIYIMEGYGLTETTAAITVNRLNDYTFGTVGKPLGTAELRIAEDGEILARGPTVFKEYFKNPEATAEVFSGDRWFHTGDIGEITPRGSLRITDRKKELIVTSGGKNIAPQKLENLLKQIPLVSNCMVYGDKQKYLSALVTLNEVPAKDWAQREGIEAKDLQALSQHQKLLSRIEDEIKQINKQLASYETIKKFTVLPNDFTVETGELTPSLKVKRKICVEKYKTFIQGMYE